MYIEGHALFLSSVYQSLQSLGFLSRIISTLGRLEIKLIMNRAKLRIYSLSCYQKLPVKYIISCE